MHLYVHVVMCIVLYVHLCYYTPTYVRMYCARVETPSWAASAVEEQGEGEADPGLSKPQEV